MNHVHKRNIIHNYISSSKILIEFPSNHIDRVYIGGSDWSLASCTLEDIFLVYGFPTMAKMERNKTEHPWMARKLFYVYGPPNSKISLECVQKRPMYAKKVDVYLIAKMAQHIWGKEWNEDLICNVVGMDIFIAKFEAFAHEDPKNRASLSTIVQSLIAFSFNFELLPL
jgi:hypothetical protein